MIRLANKSTTELWSYLSQGYEVLVHSTETLQPTSSVSQVSSRYKTQVMLTDSVFRLRLLKNKIETNLDTDLVHEILIYFNRELDVVSFSSISYNQRTGKQDAVSEDAYIANIPLYELNNIIANLVGNVATLKQIECLNLCVRSSGFGFDIIEELRYE